MKIENKKFEEERSLYGLKDCLVKTCAFGGPTDGESPLKKVENIIVEDCSFSLRYALWHADNCKLNEVLMNISCRAPLWYCNNLLIEKSYINGPKTLRECVNTTINDCSINSSEFGWCCKNLKIVDTTIETEYPFLNSKKLELDNVTLKGKYSFQYVEDMIITNSNLDTKDAFWHCKNVTVKDSIVKGEYLGWYSNNLHLINCKIIGTQPLCECSELVLENCTMESCDLSFELSEVKASIVGNIDSIKNPIHGFINADSIGEVILDEFLPKEADCVIKKNK